MTETEWNLKRENLSLRIELAKTQAALLQKQHDACIVELQALGEKWEHEPMKHNGSGEERVPS